MAAACWDQSSCPVTTRKNLVKILSDGSVARKPFAPNLWIIQLHLRCSALLPVSSYKALGRQKGEEGEQHRGSAEDFVLSPSKLIFQGAAQFAASHSPWVKRSSRWIVTHVTETFCNQLGVRMSQEPFIQFINSLSTVCAWLLSLTEPRLLEWAKSGGYVKAIKNVRNEKGTVGFYFVIIF